MGSQSQNSLITDRGAAESPYTSQPHSVASQNRDTPNIESDREKIVFAAGLKLQQRNATPQEIILDSNGLTRIELSYIEKCKAMVTMFDTLICACHNAPHKSVKRMFSHLRSQRIWFPIFTCYNCMITFTDRSTSMKHKGVCTRKPLEHLMRLADLRKNDEMKRRLYQIFKCIKCKFLFSFYEDYCDHVDAEHVEGEGPFRCCCTQVFNKVDDFKQHIHKSCYLEYYCDICFIITSNVDDYESHCKEVHDISEGFTLLQDDNYQQRNYFRGSEVAQLQIDTPPSPKRDYKPQPLPLPQPPQLEVEPVEYTPVQKHRVVNPHSWGKGKSSACPECGKVYSNYHNMLRHLKTHDESEKTIPCYDCGEKFRLMVELKQHRQETHSSADSSREYIFSCPDCGDIYRSIEEWNKHKSTHEPQVCVECGKEFIFKSELEQHRSVHLNLKVFRDSKTQAYRSTIVSPTSNVVLMCEVCDKMFTSKDELKEHKTVHEQMPVLKAENGVQDEQKEDLSKKYSCTICNKHYLGYGGLWDHNRKKHPGKQIAHDYPRQCKHCDKMLYTGGAWVIHKRMHERLLQQEQQAPSPSTSQETSSKSSKTSRNDDNDESESYYTCKRCFKVFSNKYNLKNHMKSHGINLSPTRTQAKNNKQVWCDVCHQACQGPAELEKHKKEHDTENMPELVNEDAVEESSKPQMFPCDLCPKEFTSKFALKKHKENHIISLQNTPPAERPNYIYCKYCKVPFRKVSLLNEHMQSEHGETVATKPKQKAVPKRYPCNYCKKVFDTSGALCSHQGWHKRGKMEKHMKTQEKLFKKMAAEPIEIPDPTFQCHRCQAAFNNDTALQIHVLEKHRNVNATVISPRCTQCNVEFETAEAYDKHKQLHLIVEKKKDYKQFPCKFCPSAFTRNDTLNAHMKQHHREHYIKQLKCHVCERSFEKQNALTIHLKTHERQRLTGIVPPKPAPKGLSCSICRITFTDSKELRNHVFTAHPF